ncbi:DsbA family protein [Adhaeribacter swui]|uniref:DsbA family protein n=1 Tax=Adhaeribacter swui TaxID=2086471 RepID=A0A7G7G4H0_9BACT|nr:DsbA family protein [Adhaeribacter swui]QNF32054.1 DsbA family protein [Adhaeribacter swui]
MNNITLFYVYDALCGWCYGFGPVIEKLHQNYADKIDFQVLSGGMITGGRVGPLTHMAAYIKQASPRVTELTGVPFTEAYLNGVLEDSTYIGDSTPPAIALSILKEAQPDMQVTFARGIQKLMFQEGKKINEAPAYLNLAEQAGMSATDFTQKFADPTYLAKAQEEFALVQNWGISGFPAVVVQKQDQLYLVANGFVPYAKLAATIDKVLA